MTPFEKNIDRLNSIVCLHRQTNYSPDRGPCGEDFPLCEAKFVKDFQLQTSSCHGSGELDVHAQHMDDTQ